jgi:hypothetical protein
MNRVGATMKPMSNACEEVRIGIMLQYLMIVARQSDLLQ